MSREDIDRAVREAERYAAEDRQRKNQAQLKDSAESLLNQARRLRKKLKEADRSSLDSAVADLESAVASGSESAIRSASSRLESILNASGSWTSGPSGPQQEDGAYDA